MSANETFISPSVYNTKTTAIQTGAASLTLDDSAFSTEGDVCKTDVMQHLAEVEHQAQNLIDQHSAHASGDLTGFLSALGSSIAGTSTTVSSSLNEAGEE